MADAFAPQLGTEVRFNQPVETPSAFGALAELGSFFVGNLADSQRKQATAAPKVDTNLATFRTGLEKVEAIRQERGETAALVAERQLASNFAMAGINLDAAYEDVYTTTTGRQWAGYGQDIEATMLQKTLDDPQVQSSYVASFAVNKDWTEEQRLEYAIGQKATLEAANNEIAKSKSEAGRKWSVQTEAAYAVKVDNFLNTRLGALSVNAQQGGRVSPMDVQNLKAQWDQLKVELSRPPNISDDQWKSTQDKFANIDSLLTTFEKAASSQLLLEEFTTSLATAMTSGGDGSVESMLAGMAAIKDPATVANLAGINFSTYIMGIGKGNLNVEMTQQDLFGHILDDQGSLTGVDDPNSFLSTIPDTVKTNIDGKTPEQIFNGLDASGKLTGLVKPADLIRPDAREQFVTNAATIGAVLMNNPSEEFLSDSFLKQLVANPGFIRNVIALDVIDPEGATVARQYVRSGLNTERGRQVTNFGTIEAFLSDKGIVWDGSAYVLSPEAQGIAGAVTTPGRRGFAPMSTIAGMAPLPMDPLQEFSGIIKQAMDRRAAIGTIDSALKALEVPTTKAGGAGQEEVKGSAGSDLLGGGSSSTSTANPITYALPEAIAADTEFLDKVVSVSSELGFDPNDLLRVIDFETAGSFSPKAQPIRKDGTKISSATGLIQFLEKTAKGLGTTTADLANMTAVEQLDFVKAYFEPFKGRIKNFGDVYMAVHWPAGVGKDDSYVMYKKGSDSYNANKGLDTNGDGTVTRGETLARLFSATGKGGNPTAGTPANENTVAAAAGPAVQRAVASTSSSPMTMPSGGAPVAPVTTGEMTEATLPEAIPAESAMGTQGASELSSAIAVDKDVQAFIQEIAGDPDKTFASDAEFLAAQERGELEAGDTVVVDGDIYVIRKNGTARRLGSVNA